MTVVQSRPAPPAPVSREQADAAVAELSKAKRQWANLSVTDKAELLGHVHRDLAPLAEAWTAACCEAKGLVLEQPAAGEEWLAFSTLLRAINQLQSSLRDIAKSGRPRIPGRITNCGENQLAVRVFPLTVFDRLFFPGLTSDIWTERGIDRTSLLAEQASVYRQQERAGAVSMVLGAGNFSLLGPCDILYKMYCEGHVVLFKNHPVTAYLGPLIEQGFRSLIERGYLRVVDGGPDESNFLIHHNQVDDLHITGSDRTYEAIVFGTGAEGRARKAADQPIMTKRFTCELGNISPVIVVPGPWTARDLAYHGEHLASMLTINAGFNCLTTRLIVQHADWPHRQPLLDHARQALTTTPTRVAYYPGAQAIQRQFVSAHPEAEMIGKADEMHLPWTLIADVDANNVDDICFTTEPFCSLFSETGIPAATVEQYIERAIEFVNQHLWGTLTATILVHPKSLRDPVIGAAIQRAVAKLEYGTVGVNAWGILNYMTLAGVWGAFPGHTRKDIQSGSGFVHNSQMIPFAQKTVLRGPFRQFPKPVYFPSHRRALKMSKQLARHESARSLLNLPAIGWSALRG